MSNPPPPPISEIKVLGISLDDYSCFSKEQAGREADRGRGLSPLSTREWNRKKKCLEIIGFWQKYFKESSLSRSRLYSMFVTGS